MAVLLINPLHLMAEIVALTGKGPKPGKVVRGGSKLKKIKIIIYSGKTVRLFLSSRRLTTLAEFVYPETVPGRSLGK